MRCQDGHNSIDSLREFTKDGYGYCLTCRQYRKLIPETEGEEKLLGKEILLIKTEVIKIEPF